MLPDDGAEVFPPTDDKKELKKRRFNAWFATYLKNADKFSNIKMKPKFFFSKMTLAKVIKLRDIFIEFDEDGSSKK